MSSRLLIVVVPHDRGEKLTRAAMESGCRGGTVLIGRGLAKSNLSAILGLGESSKDMILMVVDSQSRGAIIHSIKRASMKEKKGFGEMFSIDVNSFFRSGSSGWKFFENDSNEESDETLQNENSEIQNDVQEKNMSEMITVIVNKGYADDVMAAARSAGATGGTVVNARGTARENDERFFGMHIVPEKDMLIMIVPEEKKSAVMNAIQNLKCLKEPGMGIAYSSPVEDFCMLGKK